MIAGKDANLPTSGPSGQSARFFPPRRATWRSTGYVYFPWMIGKLVRDERPLLFFGTTALLLALLALVLAGPIFVTYVQTGLVPRFPTAILTSGLMLLASLSFACGIILDTVTRGRQELKRMRYLALPAPAFDPAFIPDPD